MTHLLQLLRITLINQHEIGLNGEAEEVQSSSPINLGGGDITK
jgi:hypothetical protein